MANLKNPLKFHLRNTRTHQKEAHTKESSNQTARIYKLCVQSFKIQSICKKIFCEKMEEGQIEITQKVKQCQSRCIAKF